MKKIDEYPTRLSYLNNETENLRIEAGDNKKMILQSSYVRSGLSGVDFNKDPQENQKDIGHVLGVLAFKDGLGFTHGKAVCCTIYGWKNGREMQSIPQWARNNH